MFFICLYKFAFYSFSNYGKELVKVITYYEVVSCLLIIYFVFLLFFLFMFMIDLILFEVLSIFFCVHKHVSDNDFLC